MKLETAPELDLDEAVSLKSKSFSINIKQNSSHCNHKGVQDQNIYTLEDSRNCLEKSETKCCGNYSFRCNLFEKSKVKQKR